MEARFIVSKCHSIDEIDKAPEQKGIYAWYARLKLGKAVYDDESAGGPTVAAEQTLKALRDHTSKHKQQALDVDALANFSVAWSGKIVSMDDDFSSRPDASQPSVEARLRNVLSSFNARTSFLNALQEAFPVFASPLYIGLTIDQSLKKRLARHRDQFMKHWTFSNKDAAYADRLLQPKNFAERAIKVGLMPRDLCFYTLHLLDAELLEPQVHDDLIRSAEWLLNKWSNPILGRR